MNKQILDKMSDKINLEGEFLGYKKKILICSAGVLMTAGLFFYLGAIYEKYKLSSHGLLKTDEEKSLLTLKGDLIAKDDQKFIIKLSDGSEKSLNLDEGVTFGAKGKGTAEELLVGHLLVVSGKNNPDGSFKVTNIRLSKKSPKIEAQ